MAKLGLKTANFINGKKTFLQKIEPVFANLYFHLMLCFDGEIAGEEREMRLKQQIACFDRKTGGTIQSVSAAEDRVNILVGLSQFRAPGTFVRKLKLVSAGSFFSLS